ncbi:hypothetical protein SKAU_G00281410 [Synaphobranchus kaupii]|uniref:Reverse transcriptase/retrotransposon-derived protein RNase H-like domain-containing protein n=1 Tax=Synaphobranchus kaupii TaxID=118154 RepID=A0A9Q1EX70_SYNKA|nr:hypothetical protein SKAU_G00281410 [Synaphobranchus kaupii]
MPQGRPRSEKGKGAPSRTPVEWTRKHQETLCNLIDELTTPPVLAYPDFDLPFVLHIDASDKELGAVLYQHQNGKLRVIGYGLRTLTPTERNYRLHSGKLEFLALKCLCSPSPMPTSKGGTPCIQYHHHPTPEWVKPRYHPLHLQDPQPKACPKAQQHQSRHCPAANNMNAHSRRN